MARQVGAFALALSLVVFSWSVEAPATGVLEPVASPTGCGPRVVAAGGGWVPFAPEVLPDRYVLPSKSRSNRAEYAGKMHQLAGHPQGLLLNGRHFPEFVLRYLPKAGVPVAILSPTSQPPKARIYLLHGLGYSISSVYSVVQTARTLHAIAEGGLGQPLAEWFARRYPELRLPVEAVLYDVPPMGWAPSLDVLPTGEAMALYFRGIANELQSMSPLDDFYVCRSASCAPGLIAAETARGAVLTGATFPHPEVLQANRDELERLERAGIEKPLWDIVDPLLERFNDPLFVRRLEAAGQSAVPVLSLVGTEDPETPPLAQALWAHVLRTEPGSDFRSQIVIPGARHHVFRRREDASPTEFRDDDPDVQAFYWLLKFLKAHTR